MSSRIEGTQASLSDLFLFEATPTAEPLVGDVREVANYVEALEHGLRRGAEIPMCLRLIKELHGRLMDGVRGQELTPGEFRRDQNWIGPPGCSMAQATFVPPPPPEMGEALDALEQFIHAPTALPPLIRLALIHYQFEAIHPFRDGNGRVGRLLITLLLCMESILSAPLLYLSAYLERNREEYYRLLLRVSQAGDWAGWIAFFLRGVAEQAMDAVERSDRLRAMRESLRERFQSARAPALLLKLIDELFSSPVISVPRTAQLLGIAHSSAQANIDRLCEAGILREITGQRRNRAFAAEEILRILEY